MLEWLMLGHVVTPFPWPGELYVEPSTEEDIAYWVRASQQLPWKWPPGLAEWYERSGRQGVPVSANGMPVVEGVPI